MGTCFNYTMLIINTALNTANQFIHNLLAEYKQSGSHGIVMHYNERLNGSVVSTIRLGFPNTTFAQTISLPALIAYIPELLLSGRAVPTLFVPSTWREPVYLAI